VTQKKGTTAGPARTDREQVFIKVQTMKINLWKFGTVVCLALLGAGLSLPATAQSHGGGHGGGHVGAGGHGGGGWHGGGWRGGGPGWWGLGLGLGLGWEAAYLAYPYGYYAPYPGYDEYYVPPPAVVAPAPAPGAPPSAASSSSWYYCDSAKSYYPYVAQCPEPWRVVPATPAGPAR